MESVDLRNVPIAGGDQSNFLDLSTQMPWFQSPLFHSGDALASLDPETYRMLLAFMTDGYLIFDPEIPASTLDAVIETLNGKYQTNGRLNETRRILDAWTFNKHVRDIAAAPRVLDLLERFYQRKPIPFQTLNFNIGTEQATHSDTIHFDSIPHGYMCGVWIALEDVDIDNRPLHYYRGSHKLPVYDMADLGIVASESRGYEHYGLYEEFVAKLLERSPYERREAYIKKGQAFLWAANLFHGGSPIRDASRTRYSQVTHYYFENCAYFSPLATDFALGRIHFKQVMDIATGEPIPNRYMGRIIRPKGPIAAKFTRLGRRLRNALERP